MLGAGGYLLGNHWVRPRLREWLRKSSVLGRGNLSKRLRRQVFHAGFWVVLSAACVRSLSLLIFLTTLLPLTLWFIWVLRKARHEWEVEQTALVYLHALQGLLKGGLSLPTALFQLVETDPSPFARSLRRYLTQFHRGEGLASCLDLFRKESGIQDSAALWGMLEVVYRRGLPLAPLLERRLPGLEADGDLRMKIRELRRSALGQALLVALLPWGLLGVLGVFQPEMTKGFLESSAFLPTVALALFLEGAGGFCLWQVCRFP